MWRLWQNWQKNTRPAIRGHTNINADANHRSITRLIFKIPLSNLMA
jgi:hypothetical protein